MKRKNIAQLKLPKFWVNYIYMYRFLQILIMYGRIDFTEKQSKLENVPIKISFVILTNLISRELIRPPLHRWPIFHGYQTVHWGLLNEEKMF